MEKKVNFRERQEVTAEDLSNTGEFAQASLDHVVHDGIQDGNGWAEFDVTETGTAEVTCSTGRLYFAGKVYVAEDENVFDLINDLPNTNYKWVAIVGYGNTVDTDTQPRDFLVDATTGATEPAAVAMQSLRKAEIAKVVGLEAPQPIKPSVSGGNIVIAWVYLDATGVVSITMVEENRLPQVARNADAIDDLEDWRDTVGPQIDALRSLIASLQEQLNGLGQQSDISDLFIDVARVKEHLEIEDSHTDYDADRFLDEDESETTDVNYLAKVEEGIRFSDDASQLTNIDLFNPLNPDVVISSNMLLPKYTEERRLRVYPFYEQLSISQYTYSAHSMVQRSVSKTRIRYGEEKTVCTNNVWWKSGRYDPVKGVFYKDGETWTVVQDPGRAAKFKRLRRFWIDTYEEHYWDRIVTNRVINGQQIAQTFLNASDGWLTSIGLYFTQKDSTGDVDVCIAQVRPDGTPDLQNTLNKVTLGVSNILTAADGSVETKVTFPATFLEAGKRYAIILTTGGNHYVAMAQGTQYAQGTFFYSVDGVYQMGTFDKDMMFGLYFASFSKLRTVVDLEALSLSGGITDIDIMAPMVIPESCSITFEVQVSGLWKPLAEVQSGTTTLYGLPPLLPFRAVFVGTNDVQPAINMLDSVLAYSRPRTTFKHISTEYTLAAPTQTFKVVAVLENFYETNHNLDVKLLLGGIGAEVAHATVTDVELDPPVDARSSNHKRIKRTWTWTSAQIASPMSSVKIVTNGTTSSALDTFHIAERVHLAF